MRANLQNVVLLSHCNAQSRTVYRLHLNDMISLDGAARTTCGLQSTTIPGPEWPIVRDASPASLEDTQGMWCNGHSRAARSLLCPRKRRGVLWFMRPSMLEALWCRLDTSGLVCGSRGLWVMASGRTRRQTVGERAAASIITFV